MAAQTQSQQIVNQSQANAQARRALLRLGTPMRKNLGVSGPYAAGAQANIRLQNVGILTSLDIVVTGQMTIATAATLSSQAPFNFIQSIQLQDYTGQTRSNLSHRALEIILAARHRRQEGMANLAQINDAPASNDKTASLLYLPTAVVTPTGPNFRIRAHLPVAYDAQNDLRGAILTQTVVGELNVLVQLPTAAQLFGSTDEAVYTAGTGSVANMQVQVFQNYIFPRSLGGASLPLPMVDLNTVYELQTQGISNSDLSAGGIKYINYPNVRQVLSGVLRYNNGAAAAGAAYLYGTDITSIIVNANANTNLREFDSYTLLDDMRTRFGGEIIPGWYYLDSRRNPINTQLFGQVQVQFTPSAVNSANALTEFVTESFYLKGTSLPGVATG